MQKPYLLTF